jgi:hypothetical protein
VQAEGSERDKDQAEEELIMDASAFAAVPDAEDPLAKMASIRGTGAGEVVMAPHCSEDIGRNVVSGLLVERLQDVSACSVCLIC